MLINWEKVSSFLEKVSAPLQLVVMFVYYYINKNHATGGINGD